MAPAARKNVLNNQEKEYSLLDELIDTQFPENSKEEPTIFFRTTGFSTRLDFQEGDFVEYLDNSMCWRIGEVNNVIYENATGAIFYNIDLSRYVSSAHTRAPEEGLKEIFGFSPWVWQQWALLVLEDRLFVRKNHPRDFINTNYVLFGNKMYQEWLNNEKNVKFKSLYENSSVRIQSLLLHHILSPFRLMDEMLTWEFKESVSVYLYTSVFGSGWATTLLVFILQLGSPVLLVVAALETYENDRGTNVLCPRLSDVDDPPLNNYRITGMVLNIFVVLIYFVYVVPQTVYQFYETVGECNTPVSKINSLRYLLRKRKQDDWKMFCGYYLHKYMKSLYVAALNCVMLFVLFLSQNPVDIILNALAFEFILEIDERVQQTVWYDSNCRWILAGAIELAIRCSFYSEHFNNKTALAENYNVCSSNELNEPNPNKKEEEEIFIPNTANSIMQHLIEKQLIERRSREINWSYFPTEDGFLDIKDNGAFWFYVDLPVNFGTFSRVRNLCWYFKITREENIAKWVYDWLASDVGIFFRFRNYYQWKTWEKEILYSCPVPERAVFDGFEYDRVDNVNYLKNLAFLKQWKKGKRIFYLNYYPKKRFQNEYTRFIYHILYHLSCYKPIKKKINKNKTCTAYNLGVICLSFIEAWFYLLLLLLIVLPIPAFIALDIACY